MFEVYFLLNTNLSPPPPKKDNLEVSLEAKAAWNLQKNVYRKANNFMIFINQALCLHEF